MKKVLTVADSGLKRHGMFHKFITPHQNSLYTKFAKTGKLLTWKAMAKIETQAMMNAGAKDSFPVRRAVFRAIRELRSLGIEGAARIPWGGAR